MSYGFEPATKSRPLPTPAFLIKITPKLVYIKLGFCGFWCCDMNWYLRFNYVRRTLFIIILLSFVLRFAVAVCCCGLLLRFANSYSSFRWSDGKLISSFVYKSPSRRLQSKVKLYCVYLRWSTAKLRVYFEQNCAWHLRAIARMAITPCSKLLVYAVLWDGNATGGRHWKHFETAPDARAIERVAWCATFVVLHFVARDVISKLGHTIVAHFINMHRMKVRHTSFDAAW